MLALCLAIVVAGCGKSTADWMEQLKSPDASLRLHAVNALGDRGGEETVVRALAGALHDPDDFVRREAARSLARIGPEASSATPALVAAQRDRRPAVRKAAVEALKKVNP
jgi:HEAT repeat protein